MQVLDLLPSDGDKTTDNGSDELTEDLLEEMIVSMMHSRGVSQSLLHFSMKVPIVNVVPPARIRLWSVLLRGGRRWQKAFNTKKLEASSTATMCESLSM